MIKCKLTLITRLVLSVTPVLMAGCQAEQKEQKAFHWREVSKPGKLLYVDKIDNKKVLDLGGQSNDERYISFKVGFYDSTGAEKVSEKENLYYSYQLDKDWKATIPGDSLQVIFYQPVVALDQRIHEGVIVFELKDGARPDKLIYQDVTGNWDLQTFLLNESK